MEKKYVTPNMEITEFETEDVIVTSPVGNEDQELIEE
jgi:hypothetical protein